MEQVRTTAQNKSDQTGATWVVGIDGSDDSIRALKWAAAQASGRASTLQIVRAWNYAAMSGMDVAVPVAIEGMRPSTAYESIDDFTAEMKELGVQVESAVVFGSAAAVLIDASSQVDLLVVGSRGLGGFARLLLGSTSQQCATHAPVPVVVVPAVAPVDETITEIVVGMDASLGAKAALAWALGFASGNLAVRVVGAWHPGWLAADLHAWSIEQERANEEFNVAIDEVEQAASCRGRAHREFVAGHPGQILLEMSSSAGLIVVGQRGRRGLKAALLGSVSTEVLHRTTRPVVVVPAGG